MRYEVAVAWLFSIHMTGAAGCGGAGRRPGMRRVLPKAILKTEAGGDWTSKLLDVAALDADLECAGFYPKPF